MKSLSEKQFKTEEWEQEFYLEEDIKETVKKIETRLEKEGSDDGEGFKIIGVDKAIEYM